MNTEKIFHVWTQAGTKFIAIKDNGNVRVLDDDGNDYGSYSTVKTAKEFIKDGDTLVLGKSSLVNKEES